MVVHVDDGRTEMKAKVVECFLLIRSGVGEVRVKKSCRIRITCHVGRIDGVMSWVRWSVGKGIGIREVIEKWLGVRKVGNGVVDVVERVTIVTFLNESPVVLKL